MAKREKLIVSFFGKTGSGKSSLVNGIFETNFATDNAVACTKELQFFETASLIVIDTPGIGEELIADETYFPLYKRVLNSANLVFWVFQADTRVYKTDQLALLKFKGELNSDCKFIILLNQIDLIGQGDWNRVNNLPSAEQKELIKEKISDLRIKFQKVIDLEPESIYPVSAIHDYQILKIKNLINEQARRFHRKT